MTIMNRACVMAGLAAILSLGVASTMAQDQQQDRQRGDRGNRPNFGDPAARQQWMMDQTKERLEVKDDAEWKAIEPMVTKVMELQRQVAGDRMRGMMGGRRGGPGGQGGPGGDNADRNRGGMFGQQSPEAEALQRAVDGKASGSELKAAVTKYSEARKAKQADLEKAQAELRKVLSVRQEAIATLSGLL
jgi:hypothetical protein